jgi:hypothetical protein
MRLCKGKCRNDEVQLTISCKSNNLAAALTLLLLQGVLENEVGLDVDIHLAGFISISARRNDESKPDSDNDLSAGSSCGWSPDLAMSVNHVNMSNSNARGLIFAGSWWSFAKYGANALSASIVNCGGTSLGGKFSCLHPYMRSGVAMRKYWDFGRTPCASMFRSEFCGPRLRCAAPALCFRQKNNGSVRIICNEVNRCLLHGH